MGEAAGTGSKPEPSSGILGIYNTRTLSTWSCQAHATGQAPCLPLRRSTRAPSPLKMKEDTGSRDTKSLGWAEGWEVGWVGGGLGTGTQPVVEGTGVQHHIRSSHKHLPHLSSYLQDGNEEVRRVTQKCLKGENCPTQTQCITTMAQVCASSLVNNTWHKKLPSHSLCLPGFLCSQ